MIRNLSLVWYYKAKVQALFLIFRLLAREKKEKKKEKKRTRLSTKLRFSRLIIVCGSIAIKNRDRKIYTPLRLIFDSYPKTNDICYCRNIL